MQALADITESPAGLLLLPDETGTFRLAARWQSGQTQLPAEPLTARNRFKQETPRPVSSQLQHGAYRCLDVSNPPADNETSGHCTSEIVRL